MNPGFSCFNFLCFQANDDFNSWIRILLFYIVTNLNNRLGNKNDVRKNAFHVVWFPIQAAEEFQHFWWLVNPILIDIYIILFTPIVKLFVTKCCNFSVSLLFGTLSVFNLSCVVFIPNINIWLWRINKSQVYKQVGGPLQNFTSSLAFMK